MVHPNYNTAVFMLRCACTRHESSLKTEESCGFWLFYMKTASFFSSWQIISLLKYSYIRGRYRRQFVVPS